MSASEKAVVLPGKTRKIPLKRLFVGIFISWTACILVSALWNEIQHDKEVRGILLQAGKVTLERDDLYRQWVAMHGGVYVPVTKTTQPNPHLTPEMVSRRDLKISPDLTLTMINPAYMSRQVYELAREKDMTIGHLASLTPLNPQNMADSWEKRALIAVGKGEKEYSEMIKKDGQEYFCVLRPFRIKKPCLKCHTARGDKEGDLRGGISVALPVKDFHGSASVGVHANLLGHFLIWGIGVMGISFGYVTLTRGEAARERDEEQIFKMAHFDNLTGLVNRNLFQDRVVQAITVAKRQKKKVALLYVDLDRFKAINDTLGHEAGDSVLREVAKRLMELVRETDTVARIGGDEFVVVLQGIEDRQELAPLARKILASIRQPFLLKGSEHTVGASIGISCYPDDGEDLDVLMGKADAAMYQVKNQLGGSFRFS